MTALLDGNVLVALIFPTHVHHEAAHAWLDNHQGATFATCPITQATLLRLALREGATAAEALHLLDGVEQAPGHEFWPDDLRYSTVVMDGVMGHRQVTDAYLAALARHHHGRLVTFDGGLAALHPDVADLLPTR